MMRVVLGCAGVGDLVVDFETRDGHNLEEGLPVEVDVFEVGILLVVDIGVCEAR